MTEVTGAPMLPAVARRARRLMRDHDDGALRLLAHVLNDIDPITAPADRGLIDAALTYTTLLSLSDNPTPEIQLT